MNIYSLFEISLYSYYSYLFDGHKNAKPLIYDTISFDGSNAYLMS